MCCASLLYAVNPLRRVSAWESWRFRVIERVYLTGKCPVRCAHCCLRNTARCVRAYSTRFQGCATPNGLVAGRQVRPTCDARLRSPVHINCYVSRPVSCRLRVIGRVCFKGKKSIRGTLLLFSSERHWNVLNFFTLRADDVHPFRLSCIDMVYCAGRGWCLKGRTDEVRS